MNDANDLHGDAMERRLQRMGSRPTPPLGADAVEAIERRLMVAERTHRRWVPLLAAAAAVALLAVTVLALQNDPRDSLRPGDLSVATEPTDTTVASTTAPSTTRPGTSTVPGTTAPATVPGGSAPIETTVRTTAAPTTVPATSPTSPTSQATTPTTTPSTPTTTTEPSQPVPPASFDITVRRVGDRLVFKWPAYEGPGGLRYVLVRVGPQGLTAWPPAPAQVAATVLRIEVTTMSLTLPGTERRRWVLAVLGENRELLAVSAPVASN